MDTKIIFLLACLFVFIDGCKTHPKNSEPSVRIFFYPAKENGKKDFCFDDVKNKKEKTYSTCIDSLNNFIDIPLDLNENSISIIFSKNKKTDTLSMSYGIKIEYKDGEFQSEVSNFKIAQTTFDSTSTKHKATKILDKNVKESISIFY